MGKATSGFQAALGYSSFRLNSDNPQGRRRALLASVPARLRHTLQETLSPPHPHPGTGGCLWLGERRTGPSRGHSRPEGWKLPPPSRQTAPIQACWEQASESWAPPALTLSRVTESGCHRPCRQADLTDRTPWISCLPAPPLPSRCFLGFPGPNIPLPR